MGDRRAREGVGGLLGIRVAVARRVHAAGPCPTETRDDTWEIARAEESRLEAEVSRNGQPLLEASHPRLVGREREIAALHPLDVGTELALEPAPQAIGLHHQRHLARIAALLADESPVLPRLLAGHGPALDDDDPGAAAREVVGARAADDPCADHDHVRVALDGAHGPYSAPRVR